MHVRAVARVRDDVRVRQDVTLVGDDEAGALRALAAVEGRVDRHDAARAAGVDARRIEAVADERPAPSRSTPARRRRVRNGRRQDDRSQRRRRRRRPSPRTTRRRAPAPRRGRSDERDDGDAPLRIRLTVVTRLPLWVPGRFHVKTGPACSGAAVEVGAAPSATRTSVRPGRGFERDVAVHRGRELPRDREAEPAAGGAVAVTAVEALEHVRGVLGREPGPVVLDLEVGVLAIGAAHARPPACPGRCGRARCRRARGRSGARAARRRARPARPSTSTSSRWPPRRREARNSSSSSCATFPRSTGACSIRIRPASSRERSSRSVASFASLATCSRIVSRNSWRVASSRSSSAISSRKPPSEKSGVRSSCDAFAMNSRRARSRFSSRWRIRSNAAASSPSSSRPASTTGSSKRPPAMRSTARSSRRIRRACSEGGRVARQPARTRARSGPRRAAAAATRCDARERVDRASR